MPEMSDAIDAKKWRMLKFMNQINKQSKVMYNFELTIWNRIDGIIDDVEKEIESRHAEPSKPALDHGDPADWKWNNAEPHCATCAHDDTAECHDCHGRNKYEYDDNRKPERRTCETCNNQFTQCWNGHIVCIDGSDWTPRKEE